MRKRHGFTLLETLVYVALLTIVSTILINFILDITRSYTKAKVKSEVFSQTQQALGTIIKEIKQAKGIYTPTSYFGTGDSKRQLSLETLDPAVGGLPSGENSTFVDFYLDNQKIYVKRENQTTENLTSDLIKITSLEFILLGGNSLVIKIDAQYNTTSVKPEYQAQISLEGAATLRSY